MASHFNPHSAFPRQTTFTPDAGHGGIQRAVNAPNFGDIGVGAVRTRGPLDAAIFNNARNAMSIAGGAPGGLATVRALHSREQTTALTGAMSRGGRRLQTTAQQLGGQRPGSPLVNAMVRRGAQVVQSDATPLAVTAPGGWDPQTAPPIIRGRPNQQWDDLLDSAAPPRFDPMGRTAHSINEPLTAATPSVRAARRATQQAVQGNLF